MSCFQTLNEKGYRITRPRKLILDYIHDQGGHLTAEDIIRHVHEQIPSTNKSTIYRTLELLEENQCVFRSESPAGAIYHHAEEGHHHHLICTKCGKTVDCQDNLFAPVSRLVREKYGFQVDFRHQVMHGLCEECRIRRP